jgi:hypothetical protein
MRKLPYDCSLNVALLKRCNLRCSYCIVKHYHGMKWISDVVMDTGLCIAWRKHCLEKFLAKQDKVFCVDFSGGEPFLVRNFSQMCANICRKHYVGVTTNNTLPATRVFADIVDPSRVVRFAISVHFQQLALRGLMSSFIDSALYLKEKGFPVLPVEVAHPMFFSKAAEYEDIIKSHGLSLTWRAFRGIYKGKVYPDSYSCEELAAFHFSSEVLQSCHRIGMPCNAGYNVFCLDCRGYFLSCWSGEKKLGSIYTGLKPLASLEPCPFESCECPLYKVYDELLQEAMGKICGQ